MLYVKCFSYHEVIQVSEITLLDAAININHCPARASHIHTLTSLHRDVKMFTKRHSNVTIIYAVRAEWHVHKLNGRNWQKHWIYQGFLNVRFTAKLKGKFASKSKFSQLEIAPFLGSHSVDKMYKWWKDL